MPHTGKLNRHKTPDFHRDSQASAPGDHDARHSRGTGDGAGGYGKAGQLIGGPACDKPPLRDGAWEKEKEKWRMEEERRKREVEKEKERGKVNAPGV
ncbi:hypothetical protein EX30DRAFT_340784 [Ascodesmis nigricans]|uniref:Uncharacterized protein n=1 Tax=Ascodesmis nigricans TaxID=341454 RepID=A0A4S2MXT1_9PEZI|nr:hypothetical protein EX30DRAFT_340784 [Ascodesmis nigricans]